MIGTKAQAYQDLEYESSSQLLEYDSRRVLGRWEEAAYHALQAGENRSRMGQLCFGAEEYVEAAEDWLSATECFLLATARKQAVDVLDRLHALEADGKLPVERLDLGTALRQRERRVKDLEQSVPHFLRDFALHGYQVDVPDEEALRFLQQRVRDLAGLPELHYAIFRQAKDLGQQDLAARHLIWAARFDPDNANLVALLGYQHLMIGRSDQAVSLGTDFLTTHASDAEPVRVMLANATAWGADSREAARERADKLLRSQVDLVLLDVFQQEQAVIDPSVP